MNKQRKVLITTTYNEMGIIIDTKTEEVAQPESDSGRWERHYSRPGVYADLYWHCSKCGYKNDYQYAHVNHHYCPNCGKKMETEGSDPQQIAAQIIHDAIDNTTFAEEEYPGIKEQLHRSVEEWEKLKPVFTEIAEEYKKSCEISYINKPLEHALHEVWKKHDRRDTNRNE